MTESSFFTLSSIGTLTWERRNDFVCTWAAHQFLQMIKQSESFLVGHRGEGFIRVHLMQIRDQVREHIIRSKLFDLQNDTAVTCFASKLHQEI